MARGNVYPSAAALSFCLVLACFFQAANAQVTGTFYPSAIGEIQQGFAPFPQAAPTDIPWPRNQLMQLQSDLRLLRKPYLNLISAYANQSLIQRAGQMDSFTPHLVEFGFFPARQSEVKLSYIPTIFGLAGLRSPRVFGQEFRGTFRTQPTDRLKLSAQLGLYNFVGSQYTKGGLGVVGAAGGTYALHDRARLTFGYRRDILGSSLLATAGLKLPGSGLFVGRVKQNLYFLIADLRPTRKSLVSLYYGFGNEVGYNEKTNPFQQFGIYTTRPIYQRVPESHLSLVLPSYQFIAQGWHNDLNSVGNSVLLTQPPTDPAVYQATLQSSLLGQTMIPPPAGAKPGPGVGGYFSPKQFYVNNCNLDIAGRLFGPVYYRGGVGIGFGSSKTSFSKLNHIGFGGGANAAISYRVGRHMIFEHGWYLLQSQTVYRRQILYSQTKFIF